ncbi:MAG: hypothetical protein J7J61_00820 [Candidatus Hydrothermae bacterium]|nr:hypothetical protein [Candidatus Hydrothermae bacterium]
MEDLYLDILTTVIQLKASRGNLIYLYNKIKDEKTRKKILELINFIEEVAYTILSISDDKNEEKDKKNKNLPHFYI